MSNDAPAVFQLTIPCLVLEDGAHCGEMSRKYFDTKLGTISVRVYVCSRHDAETNRRYAQARVESKPSLNKHVRELFEDKLPGDFMSCYEIGYTPSRQYLDANRGPGTKKIQDFLERGIYDRSNIEYVIQDGIPGARKRGA